MLYVHINRKKEEQKLEARRLDFLAKAAQSGASSVATGAGPAEEEGNGGSNTVQGPSPRTMSLDESAGAAGGRDAADARHCIPDLFWSHPRQRDGANPLAATAMPAIRTAVTSVRL